MSYNNIHVIGNIYIIIAYVHYKKTTEDDTSLHVLNSPSIISKRIMILSKFEKCIRDTDFQKKVGYGYGNKNQI